MTVTVYTFERSDSGDVDTPDGESRCRGEKRRQTIADQGSLMSQNSAW